MVYEVDVSGFDGDVLVGVVSGTQPLDFLEVQVGGQKVGRLEDIPQG